MATFKIGDVVRLKSGSAPKTIEFVGTSPQGNPYVACVWEDEKGNNQRSEFHPDTLEICNSDDEPLAMILS
jgi:uncharacterized protein YodC (DUF2158 family)